MRVIGNGAREAAIRDAVGNSEVDLVIIGPEQPICDGLADELRAQGINVIGVSKEFSRLESSKLFAKEFMAKHGIKHPKVIVQAPFVVKQDGLCSGKGVKVHHDGFVEEYLGGEEISVMSLFDGKTLLNFLPIRDFKRLSADKNAPNTGGMGAYCPVALTSEQNEKLTAYLKQLEAALLAESADFKGFIYSGLVWNRDDWYVLEYNVRLGDPETQALLTHLKTDFREILTAAAEQHLDAMRLQYKDGISGCLVVAAQGYPDAPITGDEIELPLDDKIKVYHANTKAENGKLYSAGGRVLSLCTNSADPFPALRDFADKVKMKNKYYRNDVNVS
jgi:phosphoribosylamine-glycine ligase